MTRIYIVRYYDVRLPDGSITQACEVKLSYFALVIYHVMGWDIENVDGKTFVDQSKLVQNRIV